MQRYHLRRTDRELTDAGDLTQILRGGRFATIALCHDGEPYLVTLSYGYDAEREALYFHVAKSGRKLDAIAADARACATVIVDEGYEQGACKHHYRSVVMTGSMSVVQDADEKRHGLRVLVDHLEDDPAPVWERNALDGDEALGRVVVVRLDIEALTGKLGD
jgi:nitroimidazol reductase NimA-like FMN-containing flavoprotein (pyridoxamine 5'-phosphate oxidase superfamily)